jgi:hypothetical protein
LLDIDNYLSIIKWYASGSNKGEWNEEN